MPVFLVTVVLPDIHLAESTEPIGWVQQADVAESFFNIAVILVASDAQGTWPVQTFDAHVPDESLSAPSIHTLASV